MKKLGLVLGSGGSRGIAHVGFLKALDEHGIRPYCIAGCSMGSVVGGLYAKGMTPDEMFETVKTLKSKDIIDLNISPLTSKAILKTAKMTKLVDGLFGDVTFEELKIPFMCNAFDINKGKTVWFSEGKVSPCVRASSSIPLVFTPVAMGDKLLVDGGVACRMPYEAVKKMGADVTVRGRTAVIRGVERLHGAEVSACDLRGGAALVIAALKAEGESVVSELWHIDRGYALFDEKLKALGAGIVRTDL